MKIEKRFYPLIGVGGIGALLLMISVYWIFSNFSNDNKEISTNETTTARMSNDKAFSLDDMIKFQKAQENVNDPYSNEDEQSSVISLLNKKREQKEAEKSDNKAQEKLEALQSQNRSEKVNQSSQNNFDPYGNSDMWEIKEPSTPISTPQTSPNVNYASTPIIEKEKEEDMPYSLGGIAGARRKKGQTSGNFKEGKTSTKLIQAKIIAGGDQKNRVTPKNPYVEIRLLEPMWINGYELEKNKVLIAEASFSKRLSLKIHHILKDKQSIACDIEIYDVNGQPALKVIGGTGAEIEEEVSDDIGDDIASNSDIQKVPGASGIIKKIFTKTPKVYLKYDLVYLKINN